MKRTVIVVACAALELTGAASAKTIDAAEIAARYSGSFGECQNAALATADTIFCITVEANHQESRLEDAFAAAVKRLPAKRKVALRSTQLQWRKQARSKCNEAAAGEPFERIAEARRGQCMLDSIIERTIELERSR